jgi:hypothetical protein
MIYVVANRQRFIEWCRREGVDPRGRPIGVVHISRPVAAMGHILGPDDTIVAEGPFESEGLTEALRYLQTRRMTA